MGEDPLQTEADLGLVRKGIEALDFVVVQDIFGDQNERKWPMSCCRPPPGASTAASSPAPTAGFQRFEQAIPPAGNVKRDWEIISLLASELGYPMHYENNQQIWDEMRELCPLFYGVTGRNGRYRPCPVAVPDPRSSRYAMAV